METLVLSGPGDRRPQAMSVLQQQGARVEQSDESVRSTAGPVPRHAYNHGFADEGEQFITAYGAVAMAASVEPLGFRLRLHWNTGSEGEWENQGVRSAAQPDDPLAKIAELEARIKAAGLVLPEA